MKNRPLEPSKTFWGHKGKAGRSVGVSCRDFVPPEKAWPFQVVQVGGIAEKPRAFGRMPPTMHESTKHQQRGRRPVSIDRFPKNNGSGVPGSLPFHEKYVAHPQKSFRSDPFFKRGRRVQGGDPAKSVSEGATTGAHRSRHPESIDRHPKNNGSGIPGSLPFHEKYVAIRKKVFGSTPFSKGVAGCRAGALQKV